MTIQFNCPRCKSLIAFADKHAGKPARCLTCGQQMIIPADAGQKPQTIKPKVEPEVPLPGFYHAVFIDSWKIFLDRDNLMAFVFVAAAVCFKFFTAGACCIGFVAYFVAWGYLLGFYLNVIRQTALGGDKMPEIETGTSITFLWYIIRPIFTFVFAVIVVQLPLFVAMALFRDKGITWENIWQTKTAVNLILRFLFFAGLFFFPVVILTAAVVEDLPELFRLDRLIVPVFRAIVPYTVTAVLLVLACLIEANAAQYKPAADALTNAGNLAVNLTAQAVAIIAMRSIGLFYRHYACYFAD